MNRSEAFRQIATLLEREGRADLVGELEALAGSSLGRYIRTIAEVTRGLLENEHTYRLVLSDEMDPMSLFDATTGMLIEVNDAWVALYGYSREEALAMRVTAVSAEPAETESAFKKLAPGSSTRINLRWHRAKDGTVFPVEVTSGKITLGDRDVIYAVMRDISQRHDAERKLARSEASFRALIERMPDGVIVHRLGVIVYISPSARRMLGYGLDDRIDGLMAIDIVHPEDREKVVARWREMSTHGQPAPPMLERLLRTDGTSVTVEIVAHSTIFDGHHAILAIARDATARRETTTALATKERLTSRAGGADSAGAELNELMTSVLGNVELMHREMARAEAGLVGDASVAVRPHLRVMRELSARMRDVVRDLKQLDVSEGDRRARVEIPAILDLCVTMAEREILARARLVRDFGERVVVAGSEALFGQVFLNLLLTAAQAIPQGEPEANEVRVAVREPKDGYVAIEISDTGSGILAENHDRTFEPFTTSMDGDLTGLGLKTCQRIITSAGGTLTVRPNEGRGTVFRVTLPIVASPAPPES